MSAAKSHASTVGKYERLLLLGSGGAAKVWLARARGIGGFERTVALKVLHPHLLENERDGRAALLEEARVASLVRHANVVSVIDVGEEDGDVFLVMDYVDGATLARLQQMAMDRGERVPRAIALRVMLDVLAGLHAAHETRDASGRALGLVHRDVSPQNVLVGVDGVARLSDFGIAKVIGAGARTLTEQVKGKPAYMSPEQARAMPIDRRTDVWAAGIVAWELFAGRRMFQGDDMATMFSIVSEDRPRLRTVDATIDEGLDAWVARALERDPARRYGSADAMGRALLDLGLEIADARAVAEHVALEAELDLEARRIALARAKEESPAPPRRWRGVVILGLLVVLVGGVAATRLRSTNTMSRSVTASATGSSTATVSASGSATASASVSTATVSASGSATASVSVAPRRPRPRVKPRPSAGPTLLPDTLQ